MNRRYPKKGHNQDYLRISPEEPNKQNQMHPLNISHRFKQELSTANKSSLANSVDFNKYVSPFTNKQQTILVMQDISSEEQDLLNFQQPQATQYTIAITYASSSEEQNLFSLSEDQQIHLLSNICPGCDSLTFRLSTWQFMNLLKILSSEVVFNHFFKDTGICTISEARRKLRNLLIKKQIVFRYQQIESAIGEWFRQNDNLCHHRFGIILDHFLDSDHNEVKASWNLLNTSIITATQLKMLVLTRRPKLYDQFKTVLDKVLTVLKNTNLLLTYWDLYLIRQKQQVKQLIKLIQLIFS